jgi:nucleoside-diphosphate-sugar epimerase
MVRVFVSAVDSYLGRALVRRLCEEEDMEVVGTVETAAGPSVHPRRKVTASALVRGGQGCPPHSPSFPALLPINSRMHTCMC